MTRTILFGTAALFLVGVMVSGPVRADEADGQLNDMKFYAQQESNWCWAAVTQTVVQQTRGDADSQCTMASRFVAKNSGYCCRGNNGGYSYCNQPWYPGEAMSYYGVLEKYWTEPLAQAQIMKEVSQGYPVPFSVMWSTGGGHALLFYGANSYVAKGERIDTLHIWDPGNGGDKVVMSRYQAENYRGGRWSRTFTTKCPNNTCRAS